MFCIMFIEILGRWKCVLLNKVIVLLIVVIISLNELIIILNDFFSHFFK